MANPASLTITDLTANAAIARPAVQTIDTDASTVNAAFDSKTDRVLIELTNNDDTSIDVTLKAGTGAQAHTARDLTVTIAAGVSKMIGPLESARFAKADGSIDFFFDGGASPSLDVRIYRLPKQ